MRVFNVRVGKKLRIYGTYILNQKFDSIRILVLRDTTKIWKNQEYLFYIIIMQKRY